MKIVVIRSLVVWTALFLSGCTENLDPLSPGSTDGQYALGVKALVPLAVGNTWTYHVTIYDTSGTERTRYSYTLSVMDTVTADTSRIPLVVPQTDRKALKREALAWYRLQGESGVQVCWQVDSVENLRMRKADDARFYEQSAFSFRASPGDVTPPRFVGKDTVVWASGDRFLSGDDSVRTTLLSRGKDTLRTTLGSAPSYRYRQSYAVRTDHTDYYFKPGFGILLMESYQRKANGTMVRVRRDELVSYYFK